MIRFSSGLLFSVALATAAQAQGFVRMEMIPVPTVTLSTQQILTGDLNGPVALDGDTIAVGGAKVTDDSRNYQRVVLIFTRDNGTWSFSQALPIDGKVVLRPPKDSTDERPAERDEPRNNRSQSNNRGRRS